MLKSVYTTIPQSRFSSRAAIDKNRIHWIGAPELLGSRPPAILRIPPRVYKGSLFWHAVAFDKLVSLLLSRGHLDLLVAFAWYGRDSFRVCKDRGIMTVVERGSAHTLARECILDEEYERLGISQQRSGLDPRIIERELDEYELADYIAVPSEFAARSFYEMGISPAKIIRTPYGVDTERFKPAPQHRETGAFRVLTVGNLGVEKGTTYLLDSLSLMSCSDVELSLVGSLDSYITQRLLSFRWPFRFVGAVAQDQLPHYYNASSVYCLLSVQEGMSMTVLEAMACGLPVIASENTGASDIVTDGVNGFIVPLRDTHTITDRLLRLYQDPELRHEMGRRARETVLNRTWTHYGDIVAREYQRIASSTDLI